MHERDKEKKKKEKKKTRGECIYPDWRKVV